MKNLRVNSCITVAQLKKLIKDWPEINHLGEPTEVWLADSPHVSSPCVFAGMLNRRTDDEGNASADLLLETFYSRER